MEWRSFNGYSLPEYNYIKKQGVCILFPNVQTSIGNESRLPKITTEGGCSLFIFIWFTRITIVKTVWFHILSEITQVVWTHAKCKNVCQNILYIVVNFALGNALFVEIHIITSLFFVIKSKMKFGSRLSGKYWKSCVLSFDTQIIILID